MSDFKLKPTFHLLLSPLISLILIGCNAPNGYSDSSDTAGLDSTVELEATRKTQTSVSTKNDINLEHFKPLFEGDIAERAAALGEGPYKIGNPINGFVSDYIKKAFDYYNFDIEFTTEEIAQHETAREICDFVKVALFSDEIDLSEFYWRHPHTKEESLKKFDSHLYRLTDPDGRYVFFNHFYYEPGYDPRNEIEEERARKFGNSLMRKPEIYICDLDQKTILNDSESKADVKKYIAWNYQTNKECLFDLANKAYNELRSKGDDKLYEVARAHEDSLSDIGFFIFENQVHVVTIRPFFRVHWWGGAERPKPRAS